MLMTGLALTSSLDYSCHQNEISRCQLFPTFPCIFKLNFNGLRQSNRSHDVLLGWCRLKVRQNLWLIWSSAISCNQLSRTYLDNHKGIVKLHLYQMNDNFKTWVNFIFKFVFPKFSPKIFCQKFLIEKIKLMIFSNLK